MGLVGQLSVDKGLSCVTEREELSSTTPKDIYSPSTETFGPQIPLYIPSSLDRLWRDNISQFGKAYEVLVP
jgi:hypothetical protein